MRIAAYITRQTFSLPSIYLHDLDDPHERDRKSDEDEDEGEKG